MKFLEFDPFKKVTLYMSSMVMQEGLNQRGGYEDPLRGPETGRDRRSCFFCSRAK